MLDYNTCLPQHCSNIHSKIVMAALSFVSVPFAPVRFRSGYSGYSSGLNVSINRHQKIDVLACARRVPFKVSASSDDSVPPAAEDDDDDVAVSDVESTPEEILDSVIAEVSESRSSSNSSGNWELKRALVDSVEGSNRGLNANSETRAELTELITQLEAVNPTDAPTESPELLDGKWVLVYTSLSELYPLLAISYLPLVDVGEISQTINTSAGSIVNQITFTNPVSSSTVATEATYEVRSPKRIQVKFQETVISPPQVSDASEVPSSVDLFGRTIDLSQVQGILKPIQEASTTVARNLSSRPPLKVPIRSEKASSWLLTTYLDEDLRIARGDGGGVFVLAKEGSELLS